MRSEITDLTACRCLALGLGVLDQKVPSKADTLTWNNIAIDLSGAVLSFDCMQQHCAMMCNDCGWI